MPEPTANTPSPAPSGRPTAMVLPGQVMPGEKIFGRYRLVRELGRGGFGVVWQAHDEELGLDVALKFLPDLVACDPEAVEDLKREIRRGLRLTHPGIVRVHNFIREDQLAAIAMEFIDGDTLRQRKLDAPGKCLDVEQLRPLAVQLCDILGYVHEVAKLVHRDLKPGNLMVTRAGELKVADFGIASSLADSMTRMTNKPASGGTLAYMSPQQTRGETPAITDDIYALGATLYELLTGKPPFFRGDIAFQACGIVAPSMAQRRVELGVTGKQPIPESWENVVAACLAKEPEERPQSVREVRALLENAPAPAPRSRQLPAVGSLPPPLPTPARTPEAAPLTSSTARLTSALPPAPTPSAPRGFPFWPLASGALVIVAIFVWLGWRLAESGSPSVKPEPKPTPPQTLSATSNAEDAYREGLDFENGTGRPIDAAKAAALYQRASDLGHTAATARLARLYLYGFGVRRDHDRALKLAEQAAEKGDPLAANLAAVVLRGQRQDGPELARAVGYLERAAQGGAALAMLNFADHFRSGRGVAKDEARAEDLDRRAFAQWKADAAANNTEAHYWLGLCHESGRGTPRNLQAAFHEYETGAQLGHPRCMLAVAGCYDNGAGIQKDDAKAIANYQRAVDAGWLDAVLVFATQLTNGNLPKNPQRAKALFEQAIASGATDALFRLGELLYDGDLSVRDEARAVDLFRQAAEAGESDGWWRLGLAYENGRGLAPSDTEAFRCYQHAAEQDDRVGLYYVGRALRLGKGTTRDAASARGYFERAATAGLFAAMVDLGEMLREGEGGQKDVARSAKLFAQAANGGYASGQFHYAYACETGLGVEQNVAQAVFWYGKAAAQGLAAAQANLGAFYLSGRGVPKDANRAVELFRFAAGTGNAWGQTQLGWCYEAGNGVPQDSREAYGWFLRAAQQGQAAAQLQVGWYLHNGTAGQRDYAAAREWYEKSAAQGNARALNNLGVLYQGGLGVKLSRSKAIEYYRRAAAGGDELGTKNLHALGVK